MVGGARTGSGKTAAFALPLLHRLIEGGGKVRALVLAPTRELALQVSEAMSTYARGTPIRLLTIYGGTPYPPQLRALHRGVDVVVGTPGRVLDLAERGALDLSGIEVLVLDEADEMLHLGFIEDIERVLAMAPDERQVALFSATMPPPIRKVADAHLKNPVSVQVESRALSVDHVTQFYVRVPVRHKLDALQRLLDAEQCEAALVFARTKASCAQIADTLAQRGRSVDALHGDLSQAARERVLMRLRKKRLVVLVATDVAARGIDVNHISHVINYDLPHNAEAYLHRIGRTARAGRSGVAITLVPPKERRRMKFFENFLKTTIEELPVPTNADIARSQRKGLGRSLADVLGTDGVLDEERAWLKELAEENGLELEDVAAAAIRLLAASRGGSMVSAEAEAPKWTEKKDFGALNEVEIFLPIGSRMGVLPGDLVAALARQANVDGQNFGKISIHERKSFVAMPAAVADRILEVVSEIEVRNQKVALSKARLRPPGSEDFRGPPTKHRKGKPSGYGGDKRRSWKNNKGAKRHD